MARTQAADYDAKRETITAKAAELFAEKGFSGASIADLADRCQVSKSLIYHYYSSKEAILFDVMNEHIDDLLAVVEETLSRAASPREQLRDVSRALLQRYVGASGHQKVLLYELGSLPDDLKKEIVGKQRKIISSVESILAEIDRKNAKNKHVLRAKVMLFFGMLNWTDTWYKPRGSITRDEIADMAAAILLSST